MKRIDDVDLSKINLSSSEALSESYEFEHFLINVALNKVVANLSTEGLKHYFERHPLTSDNFEERKILFKNDVFLFKLYDLIPTELSLKC